MREIRSYGSVGVRGGNEPHYPEVVSGEKFNILIVRLLITIILTDGSLNNKDLFI